MGLVLLALATPLGALHSQPASPPTRWVADWGERTCAVVRSTGSVAPFTLSVRLTPGRLSPELLLVDPAWTSDPFAGVQTVSIFFAPSGERLSGVADIARLSANGPRMIEMNQLGDQFLDRFARSSALTIQLGDRILAELPIPQAAAAARALHECNDGLLRNWGADPAALAALQRQPVPIAPDGEASWISDADYPADAIRAEASGTVTYRFAVDAAGRVANCVVLVSSGYLSLDFATCRLIVARGRYQPGIGPDGQPVRVTLVRQIRWLLPPPPQH